MESRIKRPLLNPEHVVRPTLDGFRDRMAVSRPKTKRAENQQIERTLQELKTAGIGTTDMLGERRFHLGRQGES